jgi:hypothetical protein
VAVGQPQVQQVCPPCHLSFFYCQIFRIYIFPIYHRMRLLEQRYRWTQSLTVPPEPMHHKAVPIWHRLGNLCRPRKEHAFPPASCDPPTGMYDLVMSRKHVLTRLAGQHSPGMGRPTIWKEDIAVFRELTPPRLSESLVLYAGALIPLSIHRRSSETRVLHCLN